jgi:phosphohistidine swiveling domain-containing protein
VAHPKYVQVTDQWRSMEFSDLPPSELLNGAKDLLNIFGQHLGALMGSTMGPTSGSEALFTNVYEKLIRKEGDPPAPTFLMGFDNIPLKSEKALYDLAMWCRDQETLVKYIRQTQGEKLAEDYKDGETPEGIDQIVWVQWKEKFCQYLNQYGYSIYDMDFAKPLPMEEPAPILETLKLFIDGQGKNPYERQEEFSMQREQAEARIRNRVKGIKRWGFEKSLDFAQSRAPLREDGIAELGLCYPVLHAVLNELGKRFVDAGAITQPEDIYWLEGTELEEMVSELESRPMLKDFTKAISERKQIWQARKQATPPPQLPPGKKYMGFNVEGVLAGGEGEFSGDTIKGVPASPGKVTARACVLHGPEDFDQMQSGDILVAGITTPAWTPLFALASGVVTDIGGPLSHGSIVAREYGIPAVLGTGLATRIIHSGQLITLDGNSGTVTLLNGK